MRNRLLVVLNKIDLVDLNHCKMDQDKGEPVVPTCAITGEGVDMLVERIANRLVPHPPVSGDAVPFNEHHLQLLHYAKDALQAGDLQSATARIDELLQ